MSNLYEFNKDDAYRFAREQMIHTREKGSELVFNFCPICKGGKSRDKGTFSINLRTGQCECKRSSCSYRGNMITLSRDLDFELSEDVSRYYNRNDYNKKYKTLPNKTYCSEPSAIEYMKSRGISEEVCKKYEISLKDDSNDILQFPFKNPDGELKFIKYRNTSFKKGDSGSKEWCETNCMPILFGMNHCEDFTTLVITEGQIDSLTMAECGIKNAVSVPTGKNGFTWVGHCWDWIQKFEEIVVCGDCENGIITLADYISSRFGKKTRIARVEDYQGYKDANDLFRALGREAIHLLVNNAEVAISSKLKPMECVEFVDVEKMHSISTRIPKLDKILSNGFHDGQVILLTGQRGDGKSTFASMLMIEAIDQGINGMMYSGELPDFFVKNWLDRQIIGKSVLNRSDIDKCNSWYGGKLFVYDNKNFDDENGQLLETVEEAIQKKDVRFIVLDNLMTALDDCSNNDTLYRAQSNFVGKLAKMSKTYNVVFLLVAHPRKTLNATFQNDDVSGSADITNKVDVVMSYNRIFENGVELDASKRKLFVTKNRLTGKLGDVELEYHDESKRIVPVGSIPRKYIGDGFDSVDAEQFEIPF